MSIECRYAPCPFHYCNSGNPYDEGPFCDERECVFESERERFTAMRIFNLFAHENMEVHDAKNKLLYIILESRNV